jgi:hypothetical protein
MVIDIMILDEASQSMAQNCPSKSMDQISLFEAKVETYFVIRASNFSNLKPPFPSISFTWS